MYNIVTVTFKDSNTATANGVRQWDYGQILRIQGLQLPTAVEVHFALIDSKDAEGFRVNGSQFHIRLKNTRLSVSDDATKDEKIAAYKTYLVGEHEKGTPYEIVYQSLEPEFVPLPQSEQNAIRALKTYYPTTVITVDGGEVDPDIKVTYTADTKNYIDGKVSAKVASILRQYQADTANLLSLMPMETQAAMIENDTNNILENAEEMKHE